MFAIKVLTWGANRKGQLGDGQFTSCFEPKVLLPLRHRPVVSIVCGEAHTLAMTIGEAVAKGMVNNETLGYFMARTAQFFTKLGIKSEGLRFRQHLKTEMAHYACDCWDAEVSAPFLCKNTLPP